MYLIFKSDKIGDIVNAVKKALKNGALESMQIKRIMAEYHIGDKTMNEVKTELGIKPYKKMRTWYWILPGEEHTEGGEL